MEEHSAIGERILANVEDYAEIAVIVDIITSGGTAVVIQTASPARRYR